MDRPANGQYMYAVAMHIDMHAHGREGFEWDVLAIGDTWDEVVECWRTYATADQGDTVLMLRVRDTLDFDVIKALATGGLGMTISGRLELYDQSCLVKCLSESIREYTEAVIVTT